MRPGTDLGVESTLEICTALEPEINAWTTLIAMALKRHSSAATQIYYATPIPIKMYPFDAIQVLS